MEKFIYTSDAKTIETLTKLGCPLFYTNGEVHIFVNTPTFQEFNLKESNDLKIIKSNMVSL